MTRFLRRKGIPRVRNENKSAYAALAKESDNTVKEYQARKIQATHQRDTKTAAEICAAAVPVIKPSTSPTTEGGSSSL